MTTPLGTPAFSWESGPRTYWAFQSFAGAAALGAAVWAETTVVKPTSRQGKRVRRGLMGVGRMKQTPTT